MDLSGLTKLLSIFLKISLHHICQLLLQPINVPFWKYTVEKSQTNATNVTFLPLMQGLLRIILKYTLGENQTNATNVTMHPQRQAILGHIENTQWRKDK